MKTNRIILAFIALVLLVALVGGCRPVPEYLEMVFKIHGTVTDADSGLPLTSVEVVVQGTQYSEYTNASGDYELEITEGTWSVEFVKSGYVTQKHDVVVADEYGERYEIDVALAPEEQPQPTGNVIHGTVTLPAGYTGQVSPTSQLMVNVIGEDGTNQVVTMFPEDDGSYPFPYEFAIEVDAAAAFDFAMSIYDRSGDGIMANSGDLFGWNWDGITFTDGHAYGVDIVLESEVADGTLTVNVVNATAEAIGRTMYVGVVDLEGGDPYLPSNWIAAGEGVVQADGTASALAREILTLSPLTLGDPVIFPGAVYNVFFYVDLTETGPPAGTGDVGWFTTNIHTGDTTIEWEYDWLSPM